MIADFRRRLAIRLAVPGWAAAPGWRATDDDEVFEATGLGMRQHARARVHVREPLDENPDYLLEKLGTTIDGPFGRPRVQSLPEHLADGVSVFAVEQDPDGWLTARVAMARRAWGLDIVVAARTGEIERSEALFASMLELLSLVRPVAAADEEGDR